jgi:hypothetical protein
MAKRKDSVALFEVITATRRKQEAAGDRSALRTPKWWFKSKVKGQNVPAGVSAADPTEASYAAAALPPATVSATDAVALDPTVDSSSRSTEIAPAAAAPAIVQRVTPAGYVAEPQRVNIPQHVGDDDSGTQAFGLDAPSASAPSRARTGRWFRGLGSPKKVGLDPNRREVTLRFRYTTAIIVGFGICVAVGLAYVTGRKTNQANAGSRTTTSEDVRLGPINLGVLNIKPDRATTPGEADDQPRAKADDRSKSRIPPPNIKSQMDSPKPAPPTVASGAVETGLPRSMGLNYVIVQSYDSPKLAADVKAALESAGVPCTVERTVKGWTDNPNLYSVVGTYGFPNTQSSQEFRQYIKAIDAAGKKIPKGNFKPQPIRWKQ